MVQIEEGSSHLAFYGKDNVKFIEHPGTFYFNYLTCDCKHECRQNIKAKMVMQGGEPMQALCAVDGSIFSMRAVEALGHCFINPFETLFSLM